MLTSALIGCTAAALVLADGSTGLSAASLYHGVERPLMIEVELPPGHETGAIVLMNDHGDLHTDPAEVRNGPVDLAAAMPNVWRMRRAGFLQLVVDEKPVGPSLVVQPMLSRMIPVKDIPSADCQLARESSSVGSDQSISTSLVIQTPPRSPR